MTTVPYLVTVELPTIGGDPLDHSHNSFAFNGNGDNGVLVRSSILEGLQQFYDEITDSGFAVSGYLSRAVQRGVPCPVKFYDLTGHLDGSPHGPPVDIRSLGLTHDLGSDLAFPEGVAACVSIHSAYGVDPEFGVGTRPRNRDRGRVFLGPLGVGSSSADPVTKRVRLSTTFRSDLAFAASRLATRFDTTGQEWCVWSRSSATMKPVRGGWVDDRFDYQRRREDAGLIRLSWDYTPA